MTTATLDKVQIRVASNLEVDVGQLDPRVWAAMKAALEFPNPERANALREKVRGAHLMPAKLVLWRDDGVLPRGFAGQMAAGCRAFGVDVEWDDDRQEVPIYTQGWKRVKLRDYQEIACTAMEESQQGMWQAPPASGKTVTVLELIRRLGQRTVVITNKTEIAYQWRDRAEQFLGVPVGILGDGSFEVTDITVALQQTLWSRIDELDEHDFWSLFGVVILDECHHLAARTFMETVQRFPAKYRIGVSGTPDRQEGMLPLMKAAIGPIFHTTPKAELVTAGVLAKPRVQVVRTDFEFDYHGTHDHVPGDICLKAGCKRSSHTRVHRNNYSELIEKLVDNGARNAQVAMRIEHHAHEGRTQLVLSRRLKHLSDIKGLCKALGMHPDYLIDFTGKQSGKERSAISKAAADGGIVLFSTVADEALDIPRLDTLHLVYPASNVRIVEQIIGRIERTNDAKCEPLVVDYVDGEVRVLRGQFWKRWRGIYSPNKLDVAGLDGLAN